jgi:RNA polymerase sigma-70 factor (ECF subfamily)
VVAGSPQREDHAEQRREERFQRLIDADAYSALWRWCCRLSASREDTEDLLQEALALAYQRLPQLRDEAVVKGWLFAIARNLHLSRLRRERLGKDAQAVTPVPTRDDARAMAPMPTEIDPPDELLRGVREAVARLPEAQRAAVELFHFEDLSLAETAAALNVSVGNVKQRLWRARQSLLAQLSGSLRAGELERMF